MIMERAWFSKVLEKRTLRGKGRKDVVIKLNPTFNPNSRIEFESRDEKNSSYFESMMKCSTLASRFIFLSSMKITPKKRATKGKKIIVTIEFANWMSNGAKESLLLRVNDKMTRDTCATCVMRISTHRGTARYFYFSLSLPLFVSVRVSFSYVGAVVKKRPLLCSLFVTEILAGWLFAAKAELLAEKWNRVSRDASFFRAA